MLGSAATIVKRAVFDGAFRRAADRSLAVDRSFSSLVSSPLRSIAPISRNFNRNSCSIPSLQIIVVPPRNNTGGRSDDIENRAAFGDFWPLKSAAPAACPTHPSLHAGVFPHPSED